MNLQVLHLARPLLLVVDLDDLLVHRKRGRDGEDLGLDPVPGLGRFIAACSQLLDLDLIRREQRP